MTRYEKIKSMTIDEMAKFLNTCDDCDFCAYVDTCKTTDECIEGRKEWLMKDVER